MGEFMADRAYAGKFVLVDSRTVKFVGTGIRVYLHAVELQSPAGSGQGPLMRPDGIEVGRIGLAISGVVHIHKIDVAVAIQVVIGKIDLVVKCLAAVGNGLCGTLVIPLRVVASIVRLVPGKLYGAEYVEGRFELPMRIVVIVVPCRAGGAVFRVTGFVELAIECRRRIFHLERQVVEFHQYHEKTLPADSYRILRCPMHLHPGTSADPGGCRSLGRRDALVHAVEAV